MAGLHSDTQNSNLAVKFHKKAVKLDFESQRQGREIYADVDFVEIMVPGDVLTVLDQPVREDHKTRFPRQWAYYQNNNNADSREIGTPLTEWPRMTPAVIEELKAMKFFTVESIAGASDANLQRIQMIAGMSPWTLREHAQRFIRIAQEDSTVLASDEKTKQLEQELADSKAKQAASDELMKKMQEQLTALSLAVQPKKRGRKPKEQE